MTDPKPVRYLSELAENTSHWLLLCHTQVIETKGNAIPPTTLRVLRNRGLIKERKTKGNRTVWGPTEAGLALITTEEPRFLAQRSERGYTTHPALAMPDRMEGLSPGEQEAMTAEAHQREDGLRADAYLTERREIERALERIENGYADSKVSTEIRQMRARLKALDRHLKAA